MSIFEYDEEKHMKSEREEWREIGREEGLKTGLDNLSLLLKSLMEAGKPKNCSVFFPTRSTGSSCIRSISRKMNRIHS